METKRCTRKQHNVPVSEFGKASRNKDGLASWCRSCKKDYRTENKEIILASKKKYRDSRSPEQIASDKEYQSKYREEHREELLSKMAKYRDENKQELYAKKSSWYNENKDSINAARRETESNWTEEQKEKKRLLDLELYSKNKIPYLERSRERRARMRNAIVLGKPVPTIEYLKDRDGIWCFYCGCVLDFISRTKREEPDNHVHMEHLTPLSLGGKHIRENTVLACRRDNLSKNNKTLEIYLNQINTKRKNQIK